MIFQNCTAITEIWPKWKVSNFLKDQLGGKCYYCSRLDLPSSQLELHFTDYLGHQANGSRKWYLVPIRLACLSCHNNIHIAADALVFAAEAGIIVKFLADVEKRGRIFKEVNSNQKIDIPLSLVEIVYEELLNAHVLSHGAVTDPETARRISENRRAEAVKTAVTHMITTMI